jgi:hypothetical protein
LEHIRTLKKVFQNSFMVPAQTDCSPVHKPAAENVDDGLRVIAAVDIVSEIDLDSALNGPSAQIVINALDHVVKQIGPSMDVADCVDTGRLRGAGNARCACC